MGNKRYNTVQMKGSSEFSKYPSWNDGKPNLMSYLEAINLSNPIVQSQFEMVWSRWPRTIFFAKGLNIPGVETSTLELNHAGFTIPIPTHVTYGSTEINFTIIADKEGYHYYDIRNMVLQSGHPLVAGDPRATIGNNFKISPDEDTIEVRLRNSTEDSVHHHWVIHNFHPTKIGDIDLSHDSSSFVEFEVTGTFTHIDYDCGDNQEDEGQEDSQNQQGGGGEGAGGGNSSDRPDDSEVYERLEFGDSGPSSPATGGSGGAGGGNDEEEEEEEEIPDFGTYVYDPETGEGYWVEPGEPVDVDDVELPPGTEEWGEDLDPDFDWESDDWEDWNPDDWGADADSEFLVGNSDISVKTQDIEVDGETQTLVKLQGNLTPEQTQALREGGTKALLDSMNQGNEFTKEVQQDVAEEQSGISQNQQQSGGGSGGGQSQQQEEVQQEVQQVPGFKTSKLQNGNYQIVKQTAFSTMSIQTSGDMAVETQILNRLEKEYSDAKAGNKTAETQVKKRMVEIQKTKMKVVQQWLDAKNQGQQKGGGGEPQRRGMPPKMTQSHLNQMKSLFKAIKSNNDLHGQFITCVKPVEEMKKYRERIMHLMLPRRFGLARPQNNMPQRAQYEISEPDQSWIEAKPNPNHRKRSIF